MSPAALQTVTLTYGEGRKANTPNFLSPNIPNSPISWWCLSSAESKHEPEDNGTLNIVQINQSPAHTKQSRKWGWGGWGASNRK